MAYNIRKTVKSGTFVKEEVVEVTPAIITKKREKGEKRGINFFKKTFKNSCEK